jgi:hypothetical protein
MLNSSGPIISPFHAMYYSIFNYKLAVYILEQVPTFSFNIFLVYKSDISIMQFDIAIILPRPPT